jgi:Protein of unknown function (DUF2934).
MVSKKSYPFSKDQKPSIEYKDLAKAEHKIPPGESKLSKQPMKTASVQVTNNSIEKRAFEIWNERGQLPGLDIDNWFQAERELTGVIKTT